MNRMYSYTICSQAKLVKLRIRAVKILQYSGVITQPLLKVIIFYHTFNNMSMASQVAQAAETRLSRCG
jgi:hypothetical protein